MSCLLLDHLSICMALGADLQSPVTHTLSAITCHLTTRNACLWRCKDTHTSHLATSTPSVRTPIRHLMGITMECSSLGQTMPCRAGVL
ncbi:hypothetical protein IE81DRAFT_107008 [Ceraceosorus guamensis]|uniref:Secreted protein n=1 Tax=Ceraceosorus guamensis TaxID=1522189 RepID=A0A316VZE2_9BASI|nr:hypothetical protein IE81DRAFT_107008 [Ceraceosorus guamensis]PWN42956.1 hypothetical protein IE81DRAFT_107008 [Ceraceosorus guamensis]